MGKDIIGIEVVRGLEGDSIYINDHRMAGSKPWGGGRVMHAWKVERNDLIEQLESALKVKISFPQDTK